MTLDLHSLELKTNEQMKIYADLVEIFDPIIKVMAIQDHEILELAERLSSLDEGYGTRFLLRNYVIALQHPDVHDQVKTYIRASLQRIVQVMIDNVSGEGHTPACILQPTMDVGWNDAVHFNKNVEHQNNDAAIAHFLEGLRIAAPFVPGWMNSRIWEVYERILVFTKRMINRTDAKGLPHSVNPDGYSVRVRRWEIPGQLDIMASAALWKECNAALLSAPEVLRPDLEKVKSLLHNFMKRTRGPIGEIKDVNVWPRYVLDGTPSSGNDLEIYDPPGGVYKPENLRGDWPISWADFEVK